MIVDDDEKFLFCFGGVEFEIVEEENREVEESDVGRDVDIRNLKTKRGCDVTA